MLTQAQIRAVIATARTLGRNSPRALGMFALSVGLGLRAKELAALRWGDVFIQNGDIREIVHLKAAYTKGAKTRDVFPSSVQVRKALEEYHQSSGWINLDGPLFPSRGGGHLTPGSVARCMKILYLKAGLPKASSHSGRRTLITSLAEKGIDLKSLSVIAGHSNVRTTALYVEHNPARLSRIMGEVRW